MQRTITAMLCLTLLSGCASAGATARINPAPPPPAAASHADAALFSSYVAHLAIGSRVHVVLADGHHIKGTLMKADAGAIVVQPKTRIPEPPVEIALDRIATVELDSPNGNVGKTVAIGIGAGVAGVFVAFAIIAAIFAARSAGISIHLNLHHRDDRQLASNEA